MQNFTRRLMSGASLAMLAFGAPSAARASVTGNSSLRSALTSQLLGIGTGLLEDRSNVADVIALDAETLGVDRSQVESRVAAASSQLEGDRSNVDERIFFAESGLSQKYSAVAVNVSDARSDLKADDLIHTTKLDEAPLAIALTLYDAFSDHPAFPAAPPYGAGAKTTHVTQHGSNNVWNNGNNHYRATGHAAFGGIVTATGNGIVQIADPVENFFNNGKTGVMEGFATASFAGIANAHAHGVSQNAVGIGSNASNVVENSGGFIGAAAHADHAGSAIAHAVAVNQSGTGILSTEKNTVFNSGTIEAEARASDAGAAYAAAVGVHQDPLSTKASDSVDNFGLIYASAGAGHAFAANATATGVFQGFHEATSGKNIVDNDAPYGAIVAIATASHADEAKAKAVGVNQFGDATTAHNEVDNSGLIAAGALATMSGAYSAHATATGIHQIADGAKPHNKVDNENDGLIVAGAAATSGSYLAAHAYGVYQSGDGGSNAVTNLNVIEAGALVQYGGRITAFAEGVHQTEENNGKATNNVFNHGTILGVAIAYSAEYNAVASGVGIDQRVSAVTAKNYVSNNGFIGGYADANHVADGNAYAAAWGVYQLDGTATGRIVKSAHNTVLNSGTIVAVAKGSDAFRSGHANAYGVEQVGFATDPATNNVTNHGFMGASASFYLAHNIDATAVGAYQFASALGARGKVTNHVVNTASGSIVAFAKAIKGTTGYANAFGVEQIGIGHTALNYVANSGLIGASAHAVGYRFTGTTTFGGAPIFEARLASANATGVRQDPPAIPYNAHNTVINNGGTTIALADASNARTVHAHAKGIDQSADAHFANNYVDNSGLVVASAHAHNARGLTRTVTVTLSASVFHHNSHAHFNPAYATAQAYGVNQQATGYAPHNAVDNDGTIIAFARASSGNYQAATAKGVNQNVEGTANAHAVTNVVTNTGVIGGAAMAHGNDGVTHAYSATARGYAVDQHADPAATAKNSIVNPGTMGAFASASGATHDLAEAKGINQVASATNLASNYVSNEGAVVGVALARAFGTAGNVVTARAYGIDQHASATESATNRVLNGGTVIAYAAAAFGSGVDVLAKGINQVAGASETARNYVSNAGLIAGIASAHQAVHESARAYGVDQHAHGSNVQEASTAYNTVINAKGGSIVAIANVSGAYGMQAHAKGVNQVASAVDSVANYVTNDGFIGASANAHAGPFTYTREPNPVSAIAYGIDQHGSGGGGTAQNFVHNHGTVAAFASASYGRDVFAEAKGVNQHASAGRSANNYVSNEGLIAGIAIAHNASYSARARAYGVDQHASADPAFNSVQNSAYGAIGAFASASDAEYVAADAKAINQVASANVGAANYVGNSGLIVGIATAHNAYEGSAHAYGVDQRAGGTGASSATNAHNTVLNNLGGSIAAVAHVSNNVGFLEIAEAKGVNQSATASKLAANYVSNNGFIGASAVAHGSTDKGFPFLADARAYGVDQHATATTSSGVAHNTVNNHGVIAAFASASYDFLALAEAKGVNQHASGSAANNYVSNEGIIAGIAIAKGNGELYEASAQAYGVDQYARGEPAFNSVQNTRYAAIGAFASASFGEYVAAQAKAVSQDAHADGQASNYVANSGLIAGVAIAHGQTNFPYTSHPAYSASARAWGVDQHAHGSVAHNSVVNTGTIAAAADAYFAFSQPYEDAHAFAEADAVDQYARATQYSAVNVVHNNADAKGLIIATANASYADSVTAEAVAVKQRATGVGSGIVLNGVSNAGIIGAGAHAHGGEFGAYASASGIAQHARGNDFVINVVDNAGTIVAFADASEADVAYAKARGIDQDVHGEGSTAVNNYVSNTANGIIGAFARATADFAASAAAYGVRQIAHGESRAHDLLYNHGGFIGAVASASASEDDFASAEAKAVDQWAYAGSTAVNYVSNDHGLIAAAALAVGHSDVDASARAYGADQHAGRGTTANNTVVNFGSFTTAYGAPNGAIAASASASASADAHAKAYGVNQQADASEVASNKVVNDGGLIYAVASAHGHRTFSATYSALTDTAAASYASARAYGVNQHATGGKDISSAHNSVFNSGVIFAGAGAFNAVHATALAKGVNQEADGTATAKNTVSNHGLISAVAIARDASYTSHSSSSANARAYGVDQHATGPQAHNFVFNDGTIIAHAAASNGHNANAEAKGVNQVADPVTGTAANHVQNYTGLIEGSAYAQAFTYTSSAGKASARAYGVDQHATGGLHADNTVTNIGHHSGTLPSTEIHYGAIEAFASASGANTADALAKGVNEDAHADYLAANEVFNDGAFILAKATAYNAVVFRSTYTSNTPSGGPTTNYFIHTNIQGGTASARAYGVDQHARGELARNNVFNTGTIVAIASGYSASALARAEAKGVNQVGGARTATNTVDNLGVIQAYAFAHKANGYTTSVHHYTAYSASPNGNGFGTTTTTTFHRGLASARAYGVDQHAGAEHANNYVSNHGVIFAFASASNGPDNQAFAEAKGVNQEADAYAANNYVANSDSHLIQGSAHAHGSSDFGSVPLNAYEATAKAYGVDQHAHGEHPFNHVVNQGFIQGTAVASSATHLFAEAKGVNQVATGDDGYHGVSNLVDNSWLIHGAATADKGYSATAKAWGVDQRAHGGDVYNFVDNSYGGAIVAGAVASSASVAHADAAAIYQGAVGYSSAHNRVDNSDFGYIGASAHAFGYTDPGIIAHASATGIGQNAHAYGVARNTATNDWIIDAIAQATNAGHETADAYGINQQAHSTSPVGAAANYVSNYGDIYANAKATGVCRSGDCFDTGTGFANAAGVAQSAQGYQAYNHVFNEDFITADATAKDADTEDAYAFGVGQYANGYVARNAVDNTWVIEASAFASGGYAARAFAHGINQDVQGGQDAATDAVYNSGLINAHAHAEAGTDDDPHATASAFGIEQYFDAPAPNVTDTNDFGGRIHAVASATVYSGTYLHDTAKANAFGIDASGYANHLHVNISNTSEITATATARVNTGTHATAKAYGIRVFANHSAEASGLVSGRIANNDGFIGADAFASHASGGGQATAVGIGVSAAKFTGTIYNSGSIDAQAFAGRHAQATAIRIGNDGYTAADGLARITNNGGFVFASTGEAVSRTTDGDITGVVDREPGNAINVEDAPNQVSIVLEGVNQTGEIFGNIEDAENPLKWTNSITVVDGVTYFDGSINPELNPASAPSLATGGSLTVASNGTLWLASKGTSFWGQNPVLNVNSYSQPGTLRVGVSGLDNGMINANTVSLTGGNVQVVLNPYVLYDGSNTYDVVNALSGDIGGANEWTSVSILSGNPSSPLLSVMAVYTPTEAGFTLTRTAFDAVSGLTPNEEAVADGLEGGYSISLTGGALAFYQSLFQLNGTQYPAALNMLSDSQAGEVVQENVVSANGFVDIIQDRMGSMASVLGAGGLATPSGGHGITLWGTPYGAWNNTASTISGPGYADSRAGLVIGADVGLDNGNAILGIAGNFESKSIKHFEDGQWNSLTGGGGGSSIGWDIALYGRVANFTDSTLYLQGSASYGTYDDATLREVSLPVLPTMSFPTGASPGRDALSPTVQDVPLSSTWMSAKFNSAVWSIYGEGGLPIDLGDPSVNFTPYVGIRYVNSTSGAFAEHSSSSSPGLAAAALDVRDASASELATYLGAELSTQIPMSNGQALMPSLRVAWEHNFDDPWTLTAYFSGVGPSSQFTINGSAWSRDSGLIDFGLSMLFQDNLMGTIGYDANLNSTQVDQSVYGRVDFKF